MPSSTSTLLKTHSASICKLQTQQLGVCTVKKGGETMKSRFATILLAVLVVTTACKASSPTPSAATDEGMDRSVNPGDDFYAYVNGGWLKTTEIPADKSIVFGVMLDDETRKRVAALIQKSANTGAGLSDEAKKVGDFFSSYVDEGTIEA